MKNVIVLLLGTLSCSTTLFAQADHIEKENYRKLFVGACVAEAKKQKLNINVKDFCDCSFDKLYTRVEASGVDLTDDANIIDKISSSKEYELEVEQCLQDVMSNNNGSAMDSELKKICNKSMSKNKFMRKNTNVEEICDCTIAKFKDSQYTLMDFGRMPQEDATAFFEKISQECILYYFENKK